MANEANHNTLPWVQGNHLELALPMKIVYFTPNGKITQDYEPPTGSTICVEFQSNVNALCFTPTIEGNVLHVTDNGELPVGTYAVNIHVTEPNGDKRCSKLKNSIVVYDDNEETVDEFDDFPDWADGAIIDNEVFYFAGTKEIEYVTVDTFGQLPEEGVIGNIYRVASYDGTQVNPNAYAEYYWTGSQYKLLDTKNYGIDEKPEDGSNNLVKSGGIKSALDEKANKNGYYETLGAGTANNLRAVDAHDDTFIYRKAGGSQEIANGTAFIEGIKGQTVAWNQLILLGTTLKAEIHSSINNEILTIQCYSSDRINQWNLIPIKGILGRKYICCFNYSSSIDFNFGGAFVSQTYKRLQSISYKQLSVYTICNNKDRGLYFQVPVSYSPTTDDFISIKDIQVFDLTLIYGAGNEPSTPEQFEADYQRWFGKPLNYEPYDAGSLRNVQLSGLKTVGFNQYNLTTGTANLIGGNQYQITGTYTSLTLNDETITPDSNGKFTPSVGGTLTVTGGSTDTCVHLVWSGTKDGTYEPYEEHEVSIPVTTLKGKLNGEGESVVIFPDGMKGVGDIKDEIYHAGGKTYAVKRVGRVDLGSLTWNYNANHRVFFTMLSTFLNQGWIICPKYSLLYKATPGNMYDKTISNHEGYSPRGIIIKDSSYSDVETFKVAMSGVMCDYELAEPLVYEVDDFSLPVNYEVNNWGTEEIVNVKNTQFVSPTLTLRYSIDAARTIENLPVGYQSQESMANLLNALGAAMGGTWTTTFDTTTNRYTYTFRSN